MLHRMADSDNSMTIEQLAEVYRTEQSSKLLSRVRPDLYPAMAELLKKQRMTYDRLLASSPDSIECEGAGTRRTKGQRLSKQIVELRMGKICRLALRASMEKNPEAIDELTPEEKTYYEQMVLLSRNHKAILNRLAGSITYKTQVLKEDPAPEPVKEVGEKIPAPIQDESIPIPEVAIPMEEIVEEEPEVYVEIPADELDGMDPEKKAEPVKETLEEDGPGMVTVRVLQDIPTFAGTLRDYTLHKEMVVNVPEDVANILLNRGLAVKITVSP